MAADAMSMSETNRHRPKIKPGMGVYVWIRGWTKATVLKPTCRKHRTQRWWIHVEEHGQMLARRSEIRTINEDDARKALMV